MQGKILVIDDEKAIGTILSDILTDEGFLVFTACDGPTALTLLKQEPIDVIFLDIQMPLMGGIDVLKIVKEHYPIIQVIVISGHASIDIAVKAVKLGAFDFIEKPIDLSRVLTTTQNALKITQLTQENFRLKHASYQPLIGSSRATEALKQQAKQIATSTASCLITGENGSGKELVAQMIHQHSHRSDHPFIAVNCAAIPDTLIESEFFGHEKGSFTGAFEQKIGKIEQAHKGTLFLDEVGDLSLTAQAKLLRVLQEQTFTRVGGNKLIKVDVRFIAATNKNLKQAIQQGQFREDLFFRLNVLPLTLTPLRERNEDIADLISFFSKQLNAGKNRIFSPQVLQYLTEQPWLGNVRELKNFCERLFILSPMEEFTIEEVKKYLTIDTTPNPQSPSPFYSMKLAEARNALEQQLIDYALQQWGSVSLAAEKLGLYPSNLHAKIKKLGIKTSKKE